MDIRFKSLYNAWEYWMIGYLSWERVSTGKNCYDPAFKSEWSINCLGGENKIPSDKRNVVIVRYEGKWRILSCIDLRYAVCNSGKSHNHTSIPDYLLNPREVLAQIYSFATRGMINAKTVEDKFNPSSGPHDSSGLDRFETMKARLLKVNLFRSGCDF